MTGLEFPAAAWRKSSFSNTNGNCVEVNLAWQKSTYSNGDGNCVEVNTTRPSLVGVRDSKDKSGPVLTFDTGQWVAFTRAVKGGRFG